MLMESDAVTFHQIMKQCQKLPNIISDCIQLSLKEVQFDGKQGVLLIRLQHIKNYYSLVFSGFRQCNVIYSKKC